MSLKDFWHKTKDYLKEVNPFLLMGVLFIIVLIVPSQNSIWSQIRTARQLKEKQEEYRYYQQEIKQSQKNLDEIKYKKDMLEKYAREKYLMKEDDEDLYLLKNPDKR